MAEETTTQQEYRVVGKPVPRIEGVGKVTGRTVYADDIKLPRMLHAKVLGSPYAHARILSIDAERARSHPGVEAVITAKELPPYKANPSNRRGIIFAQGEALFYGQPLAAVLASDPHVAEEALERALVLGRGDDEDRADPREHERGERIVDHRLVVDRDELLAHREGQRVQAGAGAAGENDPLYGIPHGFLRV
jgi:xanthine dehydrogenase molybdopterin-binding subunit B